MTSASPPAPKRSSRPSLRDLQMRHLDEGRPLPAALEAELRNDPRPGAKALLAKVDQRRYARRAEGQRLRKMVRYESALWSRGLTLIAGVDEAGMSPLAGPVVAGAVVLPPGARLAEVDDSKKLDAKTRGRLALTIRTTCVAWGVGFALPEEIDRLNIYWAGLLAMRRAVEALGLVPEHLLIDARKLHDVPVPQERIVKGDEKSLSIAAASILAKTSRDAYMTELDREHPAYGFARHKGYPVREHVEALFAHGACPEHRRSFDPVRRALGLPPLPPWPSPRERSLGAPSSDPSEGLDRS